MVRECWAQVEESIGTNAVVDGHADNPVASEPAAVVHGRRARAVLEGTARDPDHHRLPDRPQTGRPEVKVQATLTGDGMFCDEHIPRRQIRQLRRLRAEREHVADAAPCFNWLWRPKPSVAKGVAQRMGCP